MQLVKKKDSIENQYYSKIKQLQSQIESVPNFKEQLLKYSSELEELDMIDPVDQTEYNLVRIAYLKSDIARLKEEIKALESDSLMTSYYLTIGPTINKFYQAVNNKNDRLMTFEEIIKNTNQPKSNQMNQIFPEGASHLPSLKRSSMSSISGWINSMFLWKN